MDSARAESSSQMPVGDATVGEDYDSIPKLLQEFTHIPTIDNAWMFTSQSGSQGMFLISQPDLLANKMRKYILSSHISKENNNSVNVQWAQFPIEMMSVSTVVPSPSGLKLLVVRNSDDNSPTRFEIWSQGHVLQEFHVPCSVHGSVYTDGWFEGISWNSDETLIAYIAEEPVPPKPVFTGLSNKKGCFTDKDSGTWKGEGDWEEDWGETYAGKRQPALFVINLNSGEVRAVEGRGKSLSVGQVVWAPSTVESQYLVVVGWPSDFRKLGIKYCYNRPCALYAVRAPDFDADGNQIRRSTTEAVEWVNLTPSISSAFFPRFSPDGKYLAFLSGKSAVDSGSHMATDSLQRIDWPADGNLSLAKITEVVPVVMCAHEDGFPGLYCSNIIRQPWLSDGQTLILTSAWGSTEAILSVNMLSGFVSRISPSNSNFSWNILTLDGDNIFAVCSSPVDVPALKYGSAVGNETKEGTWNWLDISCPISGGSGKVRSLMSSKQFTIMKIPVRGNSENFTEGARKPFEAIFVSSKSSNGACDPMIVILHGGPHSVSVTIFSKTAAFLASLGYSLLIVNYRGSLGFGEEALQSLPGKVGSQDVCDVLTAVDHVLDLRLADPLKIAVIGISHGGFLTTHLIGQAPDKFAAAVARNPVCNLALMVGTSDIPDWCYKVAYGSEARSVYSGNPSAEHLALLYSKSPISHLSQVETPTLFLLGAKDLRVPMSDGLQYARALKEKGVPTKVMVFPNDVHEIKRPQSSFESFLNVGIWFKKYCS